MPPTKHAALGASGAHRWMNCPGSIRQSKGMPDETSEYAILGTAAHALGERCLNEGLDPETFLYTAFKVVEDGRDEYVDVDEDMVEAVKTYADYVLSRVTHPDDKLYLEERFDLAPLHPPGPMFGTSDALLWHPSSRWLEVIDYKHGEGVAVDAKDNPQLLMYGLGGVVKLQVIPEKITVTIVQPRGHHPEGSIRSADYTFEELREFKHRLFNAAKETQAEDAPLHAGPWCRFCKAKPVCPEQRQYAIEVAQTEFDIPEQEPQLPSPDRISEEQLRIILERADTVIEWLKSVEGYVTHLLDSGQEFPGYKLIEGRSNRKWADPDAADAFLKNKRVKVAERYSKKLISPAQAEKIAKKHGFEIKPELIDKPKGKPKLVPETDPRPALVPSAQDDFDALPLLEDAN